MRVLAGSNDGVVGFALNMVAVVHWRSFSGRIVFNGGRGSGIPVQVGHKGIEAIYPSGCGHHHFLYIEQYASVESGFAGE
jgi:hypothetical protein